VPPEARFDELLKGSSLPDIGELIDKALDAIERDNPEQLRGVLPKIYARAPIQPARLGSLVETIARIGFGKDPEVARDILGRTYEYFIREFARKEGHRGGEFFTPRSVTRLIVEMLEPFEGRVLDPACGSGGLFVQSVAFVQAHGGRARQISILGQENNQATWRICKMNLAIHGLSGDVKLGDSLLDDKFAGARADFVMANPPFNLKKWGAASVSKDVRWTYGEPPDSNANFAWVQHFIHHLTPDGRAGFVMSNGTLSSTQNGEGQIREQIVAADLVDCVVACPGQLFFTTPIPVCLWFLDRNKASSSERDRRDETLFIDARLFGRKMTRTQFEFTDEEIERIVRTYHAWRGEPEAGVYEAEPGFSGSATSSDIAADGFNLNPGRYVGARETDLDVGTFGEKMAKLSTELDRHFVRSAELEEQIRTDLRELGYG
jgi:type I restriction enzyme M protein